MRRTGPDFAVDDVARSAGVSKTVIYRYFTDKDELVDAVLERISTRDPAAAAARRAGRATTPTTGPRLRAVIAAFVSLIEDEPELYRFAYAQAGRSGRADLVAATEHQIAEALGAADGRAAGRRPAGPTEAGHDLGLRRRRHGAAGRALVVERPPGPRGRARRPADGLAHGGLDALLPPRRLNRRTA